MITRVMKYKTVHPILDFHIVLPIVDISEYLGIY
jgi:hypothetical protein